MLMMVHVLNARTILEWTNGMTDASILPVTALDRMGLVLIRKHGSASHYQKIVMNQI